MSQFIALLKIEFLSKASRSTKGASLFYKIFKAIIFTLGIGVIGFVALYALRSVINSCLKADLGNEFVVYFIFIVQLAQLLFGLSLTTKTLFFSTDTDLLKLPVSGRTILMSKVVYLYIKEMIFSFVLVLPIMIEFGILSGQTYVFYLLLPLFMLLFPLLPFLFSLILSVPMMYLIGYLKNKFVVILIIYICFVAGGFYLYITILDFILTILQNGGASTLFSAQMILDIKSVASYLYFPILLKNVLLNYRLLPSLLIVLAVCVVFCTVILVFAKKIYLKILLKNSEGDGNFYSKKTVIKERSITKALFFKEFLNIFRSVNYSFQYFTIVITTPLMVYFSNSIASNVGVEGLGKGVLPGVSVLVLIMFLTMGTSFAATSVTREGGNFFHTKIIPVSYKKQVTVKFLLYVIVAVPAIIVSCLVLAFFNFLSYLDAFLIAMAVSLVIIGNIASSISMDIKRPQFMYLDGKEVTKSTRNVNATLSQGFIIASIMGIGSLLVAFLVNLPAIYIVLYGFSIPYVVVELFLLFHKLEDRYRRIEA